MARASKRTQLLQAAAAIVNEQGSEYLTLDAVAKKAGVSKGGLLYHFKNKFALIQGLVDHADELYRNNVNEHVQKDDQDEGKLLRAFIEATREHRSENASITSGMLAAQGINSNLLLPLQDTYKAWQDKIERDGLDKVDATIIRLAVDGLWLSEVFGLDALRKRRLAKVLPQKADQSQFELSMMAVLTKAPVPDIRLITRQLLLQDLYIRENDLIKQLKRNFSLERAFEIIGRYFGISLEQTEEPLVELMNVLIYQHFKRNGKFSVDEWEDKWASSAPNVCALFIEEWLQRSDKEVIEERIRDWERVNRLREVLSQQELDHFTTVDTFPVVDALIIEKCIDELLHQTIHVSDRLSLIEQRLQTHWGSKGQLNAIYNTLFQAIRLEQLKLTIKRMYQEDDLYESYAAY